MAIAHVQDLPSVAATGSGSSLQSSAFGSSPATGNTVLVFVVLWKGSTVSVSSVTDTAGNTYVLDKALPFSDSGARGSVEVWRASNITGGSSFKVTVNASTTGVGIVFTTSEFSGLANSSPLDGTGASTAQNTAATSLPVGTFSTANADDLIIAHYGLDSSSSATDPGGFTRIAKFAQAAGNEDDLLTCYQIVGSTQTNINPTATYASITRYGGIGLAYQMAGGGGGGTVYTTYYFRLLNQSGGVP